MDRKIFNVYLAKMDVADNEAHAVLELPASPWELWDALEKVRLREGEELYLRSTITMISSRSLPV